MNSQGRARARVTLLLAFAALLAAAVPAFSQTLAIGANSNGMGDATGNEGDSVSLTVKMSASSTSAVTVKWRYVSGGTASSSDYSHDGGTSAQNLSFGAGQTSKTVSIDLVNDDLHEVAESFQIELYDASGATISRSRVTITIQVDPDNPDLPVFTLQPTRSVDEEDGTVAVRVVHDAFASDVTDITIAYQMVGITATAGDDFTAASGTLTFPMGRKTTQKIDIPILEDALAEPDETFEVQFAAPSVGSIEQNPAKTTVTIVDRNTRATGDPTISGPAQVGMTLSASTSDIMDVNGLTGATYAYQWIRVTEGGTEANVGTDSSSYTLTAAEQGHNIRVDVSFTDDESNPEGPLKSDETWLVMPAVVSNCAPSADPWCATLTAGDPDGDGGLVGFQASQSYGSVAPNTFTHDGTQYTVTALLGDANQDIYFGTSPNLPAGGAGLTLHIQKYSGELDLAFADAVFSSASDLWFFDNVTETMPSDLLSDVPLLRGFNRAARAPGETDVDMEVAVRLSAVPNTAASGAPTITGPAQVGMMLTAGMGDIDDDDGVGSLTYQWVRVAEDDTEDNIMGATVSTYTLMPADQGHNIRVDASLVDDANNAEGPLESDETWLVMPAAVSNCSTGSDPWCATLTVGHSTPVGDDPIAVGFRASPSYGSVAPVTFTHDGNQYTVTLLHVVGANDIAFKTSPNLPADGAGLTLHLQRYSGELDLALADAEFNAQDAWFFERAALTAPSDPLSDAQLLRVLSGFTRTPGDTDIGTQVAVRLSATDSAPAPVPVPVPADWDLIPSGLGAGDSFRLLFLSSTKRDASSTDIAVYNTFVQGRAAAGHAAIQEHASRFRAVGCTADTDARDNTSTTGAGVPIYWLKGSKAADHYEDFYDGSWDDEANDRNESGTDGPDTSQSAYYPFTGCKHDGTESFSALSVSRALGTSSVRIALPNDTDFFDSGPLSSGASVSNTETRPFYGLSPVFTVSAPTTPVDVEGTVSFGAAQYTATEGGSPATVTVHLNPAPSTQVDIPLTVSRRGTASTADFSGVPAQVTFASGQSSRSFTVRATDDNRRDPDERLLLGFGTLPSGITAGSRARTTVYLEDNDGAGTARVSFYPGTLRTNEDGGSARVTIWLDAELDHEVTIPLSATHLGGASASDYAGLPSSVTFPARVTETSLYVRATQDTDDDDGESVRIGFGTLPPGVTAGREPTKTVLLVDDDGVSEWTVWFDASSYTATEGGAGARVTVRLSDPWKPWTGTNLTVPLYVLGHGGGASASDYAGLPSSVTFTGGATTLSFTLTATDDSLDDDGESVRFGFGQLPEDVRQGTGPSTVTVALEDDDGVTEVAVSFGAATYSATEGGTAATVGVELDMAPRRSVTIPLTVTYLGGATEDDHSTIQDVTFGSNATSRSFTVTATDDSDDDDGESVQIEFGTLPDGVSRGRPANTTVSLADDDGDDAHELTVDFNAHYLHVRKLREGGASGQLTILVDKRVQSPVTIPLTVTHKGTTTAADYTGLPPSVTIPRGKDRLHINLRAVEDTDVEKDEGFRVDFGALPAGVTKGTWGKYATFVIEDNDGRRNAVLADGWVEGSELTLRYTDPLDSDPALTGRDFVVVAGAAAATVAVESVAVSGADAELTLARAVRPEEPVALTYLAAPMHPLQTLRGGPAEAPTDFPVRNETSVVKMQEELPARATIGGRLAGTPPLPAALAAAEGAERLDLSGRDLTDLAPLAGLTGLRELDLRGNAIADLTPLSGLTDLQVLNLRGNAIADIGPLAGLTGLRELNLRGNEIADIAPLAGLAQLQALDLSDNRIAAVWPLAGLTDLRELNLKGNLIADIGPLSGLAEPQVQVLDLSGNRIAAAWPLAGLTDLRRLDLSGNRIEDIAPLADLHALEVLLLDGNAAADLGPLADLQGLQNLGLSANRVADVTALAELRSLRRLDLSGNALMDVSALEGLSALEWLRLPGNPLRDAASVGRLPALRWLWLDPETPWTDPIKPRSGPGEGPTLRVERTDAQERPGVD